MNKTALPTANIATLFFSRCSMLQETSFVPSYIALANFAEAILIPSLLKAFNNY